MRTQIHGIAFRDPTMDRTHGSFDYRANAHGIWESYHSNIVLLTLGVAEEAEDFCTYLKLIKGEWGPSAESDGIAADAISLNRVDGRKAPLGVFALMQELVRTADVDFLDNEEVEILEGEDDSGPFLYVTYGKKNFLLEMKK